VMVVRKLYDTNLHWPASGVRRYQQKAEALRLRIIHMGAEAKPTPSEGHAPNCGGTISRKCTPKIMQTQGAVVIAH